MRQRSSDGVLAFSGAVAKIKVECCRFSACIETSPQVLESDRDREIHWCWYPNQGKYLANTGTGASEHWGTCFQLSNSAHTCDTLVEIPKTEAKT